MAERGHRSLSTGRPAGRFDLDNPVCSDGAMSETTIPIFEILNQVHDRNSAIAAAERLAEHFRDRGEYHRLFEARKFLARLRAGVPPFYSHPPELSSAQAAAIEADLLQACREVGAALANSGYPGAAWTYLQPLDDRAFVQSVLEQTPRHEETLSDLIQIGLFERAHPEFGYRLVLQELGTCQAISAFDSAAPSLDGEQRTILAELLVAHLHAELTRNLLAAVNRADPDGPPEREQATLGELLSSYPEPIRQSAPHLDATHLVSAMRIARFAQSDESLSKSLELARYGQLLPALLQYASEPPFNQTYPAHECYFEALLHGEAAPAVEYFRKVSAESTSPHDRHSALEVAVDLLLKTGANEAAAELALTLGPEFGSAGLAPGLIEIANRLQEPGLVLDFLRQQEDVLAFAAIQLNRAIERNPH